MVGQYRLSSARYSWNDKPSPIAQSVALRTCEQEIAGSIPGSTNILRIDSSLPAVRCFDNGYVGKQPVAWKEYCGSIELQESMDRCTGSRDVTEIRLTTALNTIQSIKNPRLQSWNTMCQSFPRYTNVRNDWPLCSPVMFPYEHVQDILGQRACRRI